MLHPFLGVVFGLSVSLTALALSPEEVWKIGWPTLTGPSGNLQPLEGGTPLVEDLSQARLLWVSEDRSLGSAKTGSQTWVNSERVEAQIGPEATRLKGNWAGVVVAEGRVYGSSWVPAGPVFTAPYKTNRPYQKGETEQVPTRFHVEAEDIVICFDAETGKVLWKASEAGGLLRAGGKRGGLQVAMAIDKGQAFALGSTGRLFAYDAVSGEKRWQSDIGPAHAAVEKERQASLARAEAGQMVIPEGPGWFTSLVVADDVVISADFQGGADVGLIGFDARTGEKRWHVPRIISRYATPNVWRHGGKAYLLTATDAGTLNLLNPADGTRLWQVKGLGRNWATLSPGADIVMVNVKPGPGKRDPGLWGAYRLSPADAEKLWQLPDEPRHEVSTWLDNGARQHAFVRGDRVLLHTLGSKEAKAPGRMLLLNAADGKILAEATKGNSDLQTIDELILWTGSRAYVRADHSHGASHGGRHPLIAWATEEGRLAPLMDPRRPGGLDLVDFDTAYEVLMQVPLVDGRLFERLADGRLACYDLRKVPDTETWDLELNGGQIGLPAALPLRLWAGADSRIDGKMWSADAAEAALPYETYRRRATWEKIDTSAFLRSQHGFEGEIGAHFGTHVWPIRVELRGEGDLLSGVWTRRFPAAAERQNVSGTLQGQVSSVRGYPTPWLKETPWTAYGQHPEGAQTLILGLDQAIPHRPPLKGLTLSLDAGPEGWLRAAGVAFRYSQAWHEVDPSALKREGDRIHGEVVVILNGDPYLIQKEGENGGHVARIQIDARMGDDGVIRGTYEAVWGIPWEISGEALARRIR
jgi:outer membrane protein assembly factor BamB